MDEEQYHKILTSQLNKVLPKMRLKHLWYFIEHTKPVVMGRKPSPLRYDLKVNWKNNQLREVTVIIYNFDFEDDKKHYNAVLKLQKALGVILRHSEIGSYLYRANFVLDNLGLFGAVDVEILVDGWKPMNQPNTPTHGRV